MFSIEPFDISGVVGSTQRLRVYKVRSVTERFWEKVDRDGPIPIHMPHLGPCWLWTGSKEKGYGLLNPGRRGSGSALKAHRVSYAIAHGPFRADLLVMHRCDNPSCVNPQHLMLGTDKDNSHDAKSKGRTRGNTTTRGDKHPSARLTESEVRQVRSLRDRGWTLDRIARKYRVTIANAWNIATRRTWKHVK